MTDNNSNPLVELTACLLLSFRRPGITRGLPDEKWSAGDADRSLVSARKTIVASPEYTKITAFEVKTKSWLKLRSLPSKLYRASTFLVALKAMVRVDEYLVKAKEEWLALVDAFISAYPTRRDETMARLGNVADADDYVSPETLRGLFELEYEYVTLSTPSSLKRVSAAFFQREEARLRERLKSAETDIVTDFRDQFGGMLDGMISMLDGGETDGKTQRFAGARIKRLETFMAKFLDEDNVCGDDELAAMMGRASGLLAGVDPKELKKDDTWRKSMSSTFGEIASKLSELTKPRGRRLIRLDDEEDGEVA